jgi:cytosine/adenosine deaminase-related metal-dependent hydrolase
MEQLYDMITVHAAQAMNMNEHQLKVGAPANLVVLDAPNVLEALREHNAPRFMLSGGNLVDGVKMESIAKTGVWEM